MRRFVLALSLTLAACGRTGPAGSTTSLPVSGYEVDARGAQAVIDQSWTLRGNGQPIGTIVGAVRCEDVLLLSDSDGVIRRMNLESGRTEPSIAEGRENAAFGADCDKRLVYTLGSQGFKRSARSRRILSMIDIDTGEERGSTALDLMMVTDSVASVVHGQFVVGGTWMPTPDGEYRHPPAAAFFSDKKIGFGVNLSSGKAEPAFDPYEMSCRGAGRCVGGSLSRVNGSDAVVWVAAQPASPEIGLYDDHRRLVRRLNIKSPLFLADGHTLESLDAGQSVRWSASNSLVSMAHAFGGDVVATVHQLTRLPERWQFGQPVEFEWWMNLHSLGGRKLVADIRIPGMPVGRDDTHVYAIDYGPGGRLGAPDSVKILRIPVKTGTAGFVR